MRRYLVAIPLLLLAQAVVLQSDIGRSAVAWYARPTVDFYFVVIVWPAIALIAVGRLLYVRHRRRPLRKR